MVTINQGYGNLVANYLFSEIARRTKDFSERTGKQVIRLGIGNTTEPLTPTVIEGLHNAVDHLGRKETYTGYGDEQGDERLRQALSEWYSKRGVPISPSEIFVSDGAKPDSGNVQSIFGLENVVAVQDPAYPVYVDTNVIAGRAGRQKNGLYEGLVYMPCTEDNGFFPAVPDRKVDLIYLCSPNNPTGAVATKDQLRRFIEYARKNKAVIIFDAAYFAYISDPNLPRSIFEVEGAKECAIEINSFSKYAGFTGVRLGWTVVPLELVVEGTNPGEVNAIWNRRQTTFFNGASNIAQKGGIAALSEQGQRECQGLVDFYMENAMIIWKGLTEIGLSVYGGINAPFIWMKTSDGMSSWDFFDKLLEETQVVLTPGSGFGPSGEGFIRLSAFGHREVVEKAVSSIQKNLRL